MKKFLVLGLVFIVSCGGNSETAVVDESTTTTTSTTTSSTTTTTLPTSTSTTTSPVSIVEVDPAISITCEPTATDNGEYLSFNIKVTKGSNDIEVVNIVSWFDSTRTDDLFISDSLPENEGSSRELNYKVDNSFSKYEIEVVVMDDNENFASDYCLYTVPVATTTTIPKSTGVGYDNNGGIIAPAIEFVEIITPNIKNNETFTVDALTEEQIKNGEDILNGNSISIRVKLIPGTFPLSSIQFWFHTNSGDLSFSINCQHNFYGDVYHSDLNEFIYKPTEFTFYCGDVENGENLVKSSLQIPNGDIYLSIVSLKFVSENSYLDGSYISLNFEEQGMSYYNYVGADFLDNTIQVGDGLKTVLNENHLDLNNKLPKEKIFTINK